MEPGFPNECCPRREVCTCVDKSSAAVATPKVTDETVEAAGRAMERARNPQWDDEDFETWWERDPFFCERETAWCGFQGTMKEKVLWEARICLEAALTAASASAADLSELDRLRSSNEALMKVIRRLMNGYVSTMEAGRDRIISLGGSCDPVEVMEASDPHLAEARAALSTL